MNLRILISGWATFVPGGGLIQFFPQAAQKAGGSNYTDNTIQCSHRFHKDTQVHILCRVSSPPPEEWARQGRECSNAALQLVIYLPRAAKTMCMAKGLILRHGNGMRARPVLRQQHILPSSSRSWPNTVRLDSDSAHLANFEAAPP